MLPLVSRARVDGAPPWQLCQSEDRDRNTDVVLFHCTFIMLHLHEHGEDVECLSFVVPHRPWDHWLTHVLSFGGGPVSK